MRLRGSVLIVILGLLAVLAVVGIAFVTMSSIESNTASNFALQAQFDLAADGAVDYVCQALVRDVWEYDTKPSTGTGSTYRTYTGCLMTGRFGTWPIDWPGAITNSPLTDDPANPTQDAFLATNWGSSTTPDKVAYSFRAKLPSQYVPAVNTPLRPYYLGTWGGTDGNAPFTATVTSGVPTTDGSPNNLGLLPLNPAAGKEKVISWCDPPNGLWLPELACPFENGVIRVSVTVQDHAAMVNLNAHGSPAATSPWQPYGGDSLVGKKGYFICDLSPVGVTGWLANFPIGNINRLLDGSQTPPGRWADASGPGNKRLGEIFMQNPGANTGIKDRPFTLDDEFELRRLTGTYAQSRLEQIIGQDLKSDPASATSTTIASRLSLTTVGWNAEVIPAQSGALPKCDINHAFDTRAGSQNFRGVLDSGGILNTAGTPPLGKVADQFAANVYAFAERYDPKDASKSYFKEASGLSGRYGARRQLFLSKVKVSLKAGSSGTPPTPDEWTIRVQVFYPWMGDYAGDEKPNMDSSKYKVKVYVGGTDKTIDVGTVPNKGVWETGIKIYTDLGTGKNLEKITLEVSPGPGAVDQITVASGKITARPTTAVLLRRSFGVYDEQRGPGDDPSSMVTVVYVKGWQTGNDSDWTYLQGGANASKEIPVGKGIPIRFPHSVPTSDPTGFEPWACGKIDKNNPDGFGPLPPYYRATGGEASAKKGAFKAFLRVADLNQVLCPDTDANATNYWPWITNDKATGVGDYTGATAPAAAVEATVKWNWWADTGAYVTTTPLYDSVTTVRQYRRYSGGNVFCVDSPWFDSFDNDGDGVKDSLDTGAIKDANGEHGRFCGQEFRVAGRININTATEQTLRAMGLSLAGSETAYITGTSSILAATNRRPFRSPVEILRIRPLITPDATTFLGGPLELRDYPYTLISNIATVRSDTFSIYGTVQYLRLLKGYDQPAPGAAPYSIADIKILRTRRFWALVDRSPALNYSPRDTARFIRPRIMNFQWLD